MAILLEYVSPRSPNNEALRKAATLKLFSFCCQKALTLAPTTGLRCGGSAMRIWLPGWTGRARRPRNHNNLAKRRRPYLTLRQKPERSRLGNMVWASPRLELDSGNGSWRNKSQLHEYYGTMSGL